MFEGDAFNEGVLDELTELRGELGPVAGDLLAEEHSRELAHIGGLGRAEVVDQGRNHLRILGQPLNLVLRLPPCIVVRHQELNQQQFQ